MTRAERLRRAKLATDRAAEATDRLRSCTICPRRCRVDRLAGELGYCGVGERALVAAAAPHFGEERPLVGSHGSGTIFFGGCNLRCVFCQNHHLSHQRAGRALEPEAIARLMLSLGDQGCHNINLVTPTHVVPAILAALALAWRAGLDIPIVYNCGGYESLETLALLDGLIDIYMPDLKYGEDGPATRYSDAPNYVEVSREAVREMHRQVGDLQLDPSGVATRGLLVRHLVLPDGLAGSAAVARFIAAELSPQTYVNVMAQYRPEYRAAEHPALARRPTGAELQAARRAFEEAGLSRFAEG